MQGDGNLVIYGTDSISYWGNNAFWDSGSGGSGGARLSIENAGNLIIFNSGEKPVWTSNSPNNAC